MAWYFSLACKGLSVFRHLYSTVRLSIFTFSIKTSAKFKVKHSKHKLIFPEQNDIPRRMRESSVTVTLESTTITLNRSHTSLEKLPSVAPESSKDFIVQPKRRYSKAKILFEIYTIQINQHNIKVIQKPN